MKFSVGFIARIELFGWFPCSFRNRAGHRSSWHLCIASHLRRPTRFHFEDLSRNSTSGASWHLCKWSESGALVYSVFPTIRRHRVLSGCVFSIENGIKTVNHQSSTQNMMMSKVESNIWSIVVLFCLRWNVSNDHCTRTRKIVCVLFYFHFLFFLLIVVESYSWHKDCHSERCEIKFSTPHGLPYHARMISRSQQKSSIVEDPFAPGVWEDLVILAWQS